MCGFVGFVAHADGHVPGADAGALACGRRPATAGPTARAATSRRGRGPRGGRLAIQGDARGDQPLESRRRAVRGRVQRGDPRSRGSAALRRLVAAATRPAAGPGGRRRAAPGRGRRRAGARRRSAGSTRSLRALLEGSMGALACWTGRPTSVWLARDRLGIKPLYVLDDATDGLHFASELDAPARGRARRRASLDPPDSPSSCTGSARTATCPSRASRPAARRGLADPARRAHHPLGGRQGIRDLGGSRTRTTRREDAVAATSRAWRRRPRRRGRRPGGDASLFLSGGLDSGAVALWAGAGGPACALTGRFAPRGRALDESAAAAAVAGAAGLAPRGARSVATAISSPTSPPSSGAGDARWPARARWRSGAWRARPARGAASSSRARGATSCSAATRARRSCSGGRAVDRRATRPWPRASTPPGADLAARQRAVLDRSADLRPPGSGLPGLAAGGPPGRVAGAASRADAEALGALVAEEVEAHAADAPPRRGSRHDGPRPRGAPRAVPRRRARAAAAGCPRRGSSAPTARASVRSATALAGVMPDAVRADRAEARLPDALRPRGPRRGSARRGGGARRTAASASAGWWNVRACRARSTSDAPRPRPRALRAALLGDGGRAPSSTVMLFRPEHA